MHAHTNQDGIPGATANFIRYYLGTTSLGIDGIDCRSGLSEFLEGECQLLLEKLGLRNMGCRIDFINARTPFLKDWSHSGSDYGLVGFLALLVSSLTIWRVNFKNLSWLLNFLGFALLVLNCLTIAWMPWNLRIFLSQFYFFPA